MSSKLSMAVHSGKDHGMVMEEGWAGAQGGWGMFLLQINESYFRDVVKYSPLTYSNFFNYLGNGATLPMP